MARRMRSVQDDLVAERPATLANDVAALDLWSFQQNLTFLVRFRCTRRQPEAR